MTINQLQYYIEIVRQKSFTRAAENLFVSQSALSKSVRALEQEFETELIDHSSKDFLLTPEGELFYEYARKILDFFNMQTRELHQRLHDMGGSLNIGIPPTSGTVYFYSHIREYRERYPNVNLNILEVPSKTLLKEMDMNRLDMGAVLEPFSNSQYVSKPVYRAEIVLTVSKAHPLAARKYVSFSELQNEKFLMMSSDFIYHDIIISLCKEAGFTPNIAFKSSQWDLIFEMASDNQGITFFPIPLLAKRDCANIRQIHLKNPEAHWVLSIAYRKDKFITPPMQRFLALCNEV